MIPNCKSYQVICVVEYMSPNTQISIFYSTVILYILYSDMNGATILYISPHAAGVSPTHNGQVCSTWGNYHYKTYDGDLFQLPYTCNYVLSSLCKSSSGYEAFNIQLQRGEVDGLPTITKVFLCDQSFDCCTFHY